jgi:ribosomal protein S18 acetylase RimI-like enzyme
LEAIAHLLKICEAIDPPEEWPSLSEIQMQFESPPKSVDRDRDLRLWEDPTNSQLSACAGLMIPELGEELGTFLWFRIHPEFRYNILEKEIFPWAEARMRQVAQERNVAVKLISGARNDQSDRMTAIENHGFKVDCYFITMERSLSEPLPNPEFPAGFTVSPGGQKNSTPWIELFNRTFADHWNHNDMTVEQVKHELNQAYYKPELDLVAIAPDGTLAAFCYSHVKPNPDNSTIEGLIHALGVRPAFCSMGLGKAILLAGLHQLKAEGMHKAMLYVDADNIYSALRLYQAVGFQEISTQIAYSKRL